MAAYTQEMLDTLQAAIATGTKSVYYGDKRVDYRSLDDMIRTQNIMIRALGLAAPCANRRYGEFYSGANGKFGEFIQGGLDPYYDDGFYYPGFSGI